MTELITWSFCASKRVHSVMNFADIKDGYMYNVTGHKKVMIVLVLNQSEQENWNPNSTVCMNFWELLRAFYPTFGQFTNLNSLEKQLLMIISNFNFMLENF